MARNTAVEIIYEEALAHNTSVEIKYEEALARIQTVESEMKKMVNPLDYLNDIAEIEDLF